MQLKSEWVVVGGYNDVSHKMPPAYDETTDTILELLNSSPVHTAWWATANKPQVELWIEFFAEGFAPLLVLEPGKVGVRVKRGVTSVQLSSIAVDVDGTSNALRDAVRGDLQLVMEELRRRFDLGPIPAWPTGDSAHAQQPAEELVDPAEELVNADGETGQLVVELHIPLVAVDLPDEEYPYPWILDLDDHLADLEEQGRLEVFDDSEDVVEGEDSAGERVFFLTGGSETDLLHIASDAAGRPDVPKGGYAVISDSDDVGMGRGRRVELI